MKRSICLFSLMALIAGMPQRGDAKRSSREHTYKMGLERFESWLKQVPPDHRLGKSYREAKKKQKDPFKWMFFGSMGTATTPLIEAGLTGNVSPVSMDITKFSLGMAVSSLFGRWVDRSDQRAKMRRLIEQLALAMKPSEWAALQHDKETQVARDWIVDHLQHHYPGLYPTTKYIRYGEGGDHGQASTQELERRTLEEVLEDTSFQTIRGGG